MKRASPAAARRYARALLDVALEQAAAARLREELRGAQSLLEGQRELRELLAHPAVANDEKKGMLRAVFSGRASPLLLRLLEMLLDRQRITLLPAIREAYDTLWNAQRSVAAAQAVSAQPLEASERQALEQALERATGLGIELETREDPSLLGGLLVRIEGRTYDGSLRAQIRALRARLTGGAPA
jgi:F-type H+-transporting ATPase subunit delta